ATSFSSVSARTRKVLQVRDGYECWVCEEIECAALDVAPLYSDVSELQFFRYLSQNILSPSLTHLSHPQNLIYLCARCHRLFDAQSPVIVILPSDIRFFVDWENSDYESRCKAAEDGKEVPRTVPTADDYPGKYRAYRIGEAFCAMEEKPWGGSPSAMILKACAGLFKP
ncbi:hypothetical protein V8E54_009610, partial [Elaphomyces granulatus]